MTRPQYNRLLGHNYSGTSRIWATHADHHASLRIHRDSNDLLIMDTISCVKQKKSLEDAGGETCMAHLITARMEVHPICKKMTNKWKCVKMKETKGIAMLLLVRPVCWTSFCDVAYGYHLWIRIFLWIIYLIYVNLKEQHMLLSF